MHRLRVKFLYKDGAIYEMKTAIPVEVAEKIAVAGLLATQVFVEKNIMTQVPETTIFDDFKRKN